MIKVKNFLSELNENLFGDPKPSNDESVMQGIIILIGFLSLPFLAMIAYFSYWI